MTERMIEHWALIAKAVFAAEDAISAEWFPKLRATRGAPKEVRDKLAHEYCRAIAKEIIHNAEKKD